MSRGVIEWYTCPICGKHVYLRNADGYEMAETRRVKGIKKILYIHTSCYEKIRRGNTRRLATNGWY